MKSFIISAVLAVIVIAGSMFYTYKIDKVSEKMSDINKQIISCLDKKNYEGASDKIYELKEFLDEKSTLMAAMGDHEDLDNIETNLSELEKYTEGKNRTDALSKCAVLSFLFKHLPESYHLRLENIL